MNKNTEQKIKEILIKISEDEASFIMELAIKRQIQDTILELEDINCLKDIKEEVINRIKKLSNN